VIHSAVNTFRIDIRETKWFDYKIEGCATWICW